MNRAITSTLLSVGIATAVGLVGSVFAAGSLLNSFEPLAQAPSPTPATGAPGSSGSAPTSGTPGSPTPPTASAPTGTIPGMPATPGSGMNAGGGTAQSNVVFDQLDTNKDGVLSREEFSRAIIRPQ